MSDIASSPAPWLTDTVRWWCYRLTKTFKRFQRAVQYATGHLSTDNAQHIMLDCCFGAGWHPLQILDVQETLNEAREIFTDHPALPHLIAAACSRVASKWEGNGDDSHEARRWAIEIAEDVCGTHQYQTRPLDRCSASRVIAGRRVFSLPVLVPPLQIHPHHGPPQWQNSSPLMK